MVCKRQYASQFGTEIVSSIRKTASASVRLCPQTSYQGFASEPHWGLPSSSCAPYFEPCPHLASLPLQWRFGAVAIATLVRSTPVSTGMGDRMGVQLLVREIYLSLTNYPGQLSLAIPPCVGVMSTGQRAVMLCDWE